MKCGEHRLLFCFDVISAAKWHHFNLVQGLVHIKSIPRLARAVWGKSTKRAIRVESDGFLYFRPAPPSDEIRFFIPELGIGTSRPLSISPNGRHIAFIARGANVAAIFLRPIGSMAAQQLAGTDNPSNLAWSPDSRHIVFNSGGKLKRIDIAGGPPQNLCDSPSYFRGSAWSSEGVIVFGTASGLYRVSASGGEPVKITTLDASLQETAHESPYFLPDRHHYLYMVWSTEASNRAIYVGDLHTQQKKRIATAASMPVYAEPGYLLFHREGTLFAQPFEARKLELTGEPVRVADEILYSTEDSRAGFAASQNGLLIYINGPGGARLMQLALYDRAGKQLDNVGPAGSYRGVDLSPMANESPYTGMMDRVAAMCG